ncbi:uncharacterized protein LOC118421337 [Branchiostoma floridae]|uniref:Uncharacterized protein LOC118421337 n=1 Tax=Branchiostoma floridae TaxID=7739 RepID=A0A9J7MZM9_BRAFL|nr:uncharacterized protein LOC118421337 [Branchiostoma floridae]
MSNMETMTDIITTEGIWMIEETSEASMAPRLTITSGTITPSPGETLPATGGPSAGVVAGAVVGILALILLAAGVAFIILKKRGIIFNRDDPAIPQERTDPEGSGDTFANLLGERPFGNISQRDPLPVPRSTMNNYTNTPDRPGRRQRPAQNRSQDDPLPIPDENTYLNLQDDTRDRPTNIRSQEDPLPIPDNTTYINLSEETRETPDHIRSKVPTSGNDTYANLLEATRERSLPIPDNSTYTSLMKQRSQPDGAENAYRNVHKWPGHAQPYVNVDFDGSAQVPPSPHASQSEHAGGAYEMANLEASTYENCSPSYGNVGADGNVAETSFVNNGNPDNLYEDVNPGNSIYSDCEPTYANQ